MRYFKQGIGTAWAQPNKAVRGAAARLRTFSASRASRQNKKGDGITPSPFLPVYAPLGLLANVLREHCLRLAGGRLGALRGCLDTARCRF